MEVSVNSVKLYYEIYGEGKPIILLHGNRQNHEIFDVLIDDLKKDFKVYAIDSRCHGKSEWSDDVSYDILATDVIEFIKKCNIEKPILYGFSDGGIIGLLVAIKEPNILSELIASGPNLFPKGFKKYWIWYSRLGYLFTRNRLFEMMYKEPDISLEQLSKITVPTHIIVGEKDIVLEKHTEMLADNINGATLEIVKGESHGSYINHSDKIYKILKKYI